MDGDPNNTKPESSRDCNSRHINLEVNPDILLDLIIAPDIRNFKQIDVLLEHMEGIDQSQLVEVKPPQLIPMKVWQVLFTLCVKSVSNKAEGRFSETLGIDVNLNNSSSIASSLSQSYLREYMLSLKPTIGDRSMILMNAWLNNSYSRADPMSFGQLEQLLACILVSKRRPEKVKRLLREAPRKNYDIMSHFRNLGSSQTTALSPPESQEPSRYDDDSSTFQNTSSNVLKFDENDESVDHVDDSDIISDSEEELHLIIPDKELKSFKYGDIDDDGGDYLKTPKSPIFDDSFGILETMPHLLAPLLGLLSPVSRTRSPKRRKLDNNDEKNLDFLVFGEEPLAKRLNPENSGYSIWKLLQFTFNSTNVVSMSANKKLFINVLHWVASLLEKNFYWELESRANLIGGDSDSLFDKLNYADSRSKYFFLKHVCELADKDHGLLVNNLLDQIASSKFDRFERAVEIILGDLVPQQTTTKTSYLPKCYEQDNLGLKHPEEMLDTMKKNKIRGTLLHLIYLRSIFNVIPETRSIYTNATFETPEILMDLIAEKFIQVSDVNLEILLESGFFPSKGKIAGVRTSLQFDRSLLGFSMGILSRVFLKLCGQLYLENHRIKELMALVKSSNFETNILLPNCYKQQYWLDRALEMKQLVKSVMTEEDNVEEGRLRLRKIMKLLTWIMKITGTEDNVIYHSEFDWKDWELEIDNDNTSIATF